MTNPKFEPVFITPFTLASRLGMVNDPEMDTIDTVIGRAREMLAEERVNRVKAEVELDAWREAARLTDEYCGIDDETVIHWNRGWSLYDVAHPEVK